MSPTTTATSLISSPRFWLIVPAIAFIGIILGIVFFNVPIVSDSGIYSCVIASFILGALAFLKPRRDIVAVLVPVFAILIFNPWSEVATGPVTQILFAGTITVVAWRLEKRFSTPHFTK
ncbi:hypothetical protein [Methanovulcanius yangii]|uniref:hypothetical protein n=1 Tax=Methanovulcanius yangii TaxID=1789227 RepID=UPI0029CAA862|nr:hypothetical protein [Methanovulcanius yangii]